MGKRAYARKEFEKEELGWQDQGNRIASFLLD
jgi:hypothetical protein